MAEYDDYLIRIKLKGLLLDLAGVGPSDPFDAEKALTKLLESCQYTPEPMPTKYTRTGVWALYAFDAQIVVSYVTADLHDLIERQSHEAMAEHIMFWPMGMGVNEAHTWWVEQLAAHRE